VEVGRICASCRCRCARPTLNGCWRDDPTERDARCLPSATTKRIGLRPTASAGGGRPSLGHTTKINAVSSAHTTTNELMILNVSVG
jgi:hypothetical protein